MSIRFAQHRDIERLQQIRRAVKENRLSSPDLISIADYNAFITVRGKGFVLEEGGEIKGFAICDLLDNNVWALFVHPRFEAKGIGRLLHDQMLTWYFSQGKEMIWLSTAPQTRAHRFYLTAGWTPNGKHGKFEDKFVMKKSDWTAIKNSQ